MADKNGTPPSNTDLPTDTDLAGYDHSQKRGLDQTEGDASATSDTYLDKDHDGGWSNQVAMDDYKDRSGGDAYARMSRGILEESYGRGPDGLGADAPPKAED